MAFHACQLSTKATPAPGNSHIDATWLPHASCYFEQGKTTLTQTIGFLYPDKRSTCERSKTLFIKILKNATTMGRFSTFSNHKFLIPL